MAWSCQTSVSMQFMWCELTTGQTILKVAIKDIHVWLASWNKLKMFVYSHEYNTNALYLLSCKYVLLYGMGMSVKLCKIFWLFYVPLHIIIMLNQNIHKKGLINFTIQAVVRDDYILILLGKLQCFSIKMYVSGHLPYAPCFSSQIIIIPNLSNIKTIHSFKITEVIAKLW